MAIALHDRDTVRSQLEDCGFAGRDLTRPVAKYRVPREGTLPREAFQLVSGELMLDGNAPEPGHVLPDVGGTHIPIPDGADIPATRCSASLTGCAAGAGRCPPTASPETASDIAVQRILVRLGVSQDMAAPLLDDLRDAVAQFGEHSPRLAKHVPQGGYVRGEAVLVAVLADHAAVPLTPEARTGAIMFGRDRRRVYAPGTPCGHDDALLFVRATIATRVGMV